MSNLSKRLPIVTNKSHATLLFSMLKPLRSMRCQNVLMNMIWSWRILKLNTKLSFKNSKMRLTSVNRISTRSKNNLSPKKLTAICMRQIGECLRLVISHSMKRWTWRPMRIIGFVSQWPILRLSWMTSTDQEKAKEPFRLNLKVLSLIMSTFCNCWRTLVNMLIVKIKKF